MSKRALIIVYHLDTRTNKYYFLVGFESKYVSDINNNVIPKQTFTGPSVSAAETDFDTKVSTLNDELSNTTYLGKTDKPINIGRIRYDQIVKSNNNTYTVNFRHVHETSKLGFPKGGKEITDSDIRATALRELKEECGDVLWELAKRNLVPFGPTNNFDYDSVLNNYSVFTLNITDDEINDVKHSLEQKNSSTHGELFNLRFVSYNFIIKKWGLFNRATKDAVTEFANIFMDQELDETEYYENKLSQSTLNSLKRNEHDQNGGYYQKYLKYKAKYLELKKQLEN
jgi:8-oxo-dGTP pyrophosphatase MutT (NUDIX family)